MSVRRVCADSESIKNVIDELLPQKIVALGGSAAALTAFSKDLSSICPHVRNTTHMHIYNIIYACVHVLRVNTLCIYVQIYADCRPDTDISSHDVAWVSRIRGILFKSLKFQNLTSCSVAYLETRVEEDAGAEGSSIILAPLTMEMHRGHAPVLLRNGPLRLTDLRKRLAKKGVATDVFEGGLVTTGGIVVYRKQTSTDSEGVHALCIEGPACDEYFHVRDILYSMNELV
jgi:hypothetical protein